MSEVLSEQKIDALRPDVRDLGKELLRRMTPAGLLGLPKLLDERRIQYGIPDGAFAQEAMFDRILIWQVPDRKQETFEEGGKIIMTEKQQAENRYRAPVGVVVSCGLSALDSFVSNGGQLGDKVQFVKNAPYFIRCDTIGGRDMNLIVLTAGEIVGNFDLSERLRSRKLFKKQNPTENNRVEHVFVDEAGKYIMPQTAWREES